MPEECARQLLLIVVELEMRDGDYEGSADCVLDLLFDLS
jgi:hypothetical protein